MRGESGRCPRSGASSLVQVSKPGWMRRASMEVGPGRQGAAAVLGRMSEPKWDKEGICMWNGAAWKREVGYYIQGN